METSHALTFLTFGDRLGEESLCREVDDSIIRRRFCPVELST